jgi:C4-dicarboxylate-specific signal transduction histidine kinase
MTIDAGRFNARLAISTRDEIGALVETFNLMPARCKRRSPSAPRLRSRCANANNELEQRVEERTAQLTFNRFESGDPIEMKGYWSSIDRREGDDWKFRLPVCSRA